MQTNATNLLVHTIPNWLTVADPDAPRQPTLLGGKRRLLSATTRQRMRYGVFATLSLSSVGVVPGLLVLAWLTA